MRDEDEGCETTYDNPHKICIQKSFNARCTESNSATNASDGVDYAVGTMVWTLFDYYGEPPVGGPEVSSTYGQYDLCGFPKAAAFWCVAARIRPTPGLLRALNACPHQWESPASRAQPLPRNLRVVQVPDAVAPQHPRRPRQDVPHRGEARGAPGRVLGEP